MIFIYIVCKNKEEAKKIGLYLVKQRLAACCNIFPIESIYHWSSSAKASEDKTEGKAEEPKTEGPKEDKSKAEEGEVVN